MKEIIMVMDEDPIYSKKFCNQAIKILGKKYAFLTFQNMKEARNYASDNKVESLVTSDAYSENVDDINVNSLYILNEKDKKVRREGKRTFVYKLQNVNNILEVLDDDIVKKHEKTRTRNDTKCKLILFYTPVYIKNKAEIIKKMARNLVKKKKVLVISTDEFENYKGAVGLSNVIFSYKENLLSPESMQKEIITEKEVDYIMSTTYPEDFDVINNIDFANIINEFTRLNYDFIFVNADTSFIKHRHILNDSDGVVIFKDKCSDKVDKFKSYLKYEHQIDLKKVTEFNLEKLDRTYMIAFLKQYFEKNE